MKRMLTTLVVTMLIAATSQAARQNALEKEMEDYARDFFRAHPKASGDIKPREASKKMYEDAKHAKLLDLTKEDKKKMRKREDMIGKGMFSTALEELKGLNSKDPKITFLIKYAENPKIKTDEKLLAYRLIKHNYQEAAAKVAEKRGERLTTILNKYTTYKRNNDGKAPASLADLDLPEDCKQFTNTKGEKKDWIYIGHLPSRYKAGDSHIVILEPEPFGDVRICGLDDAQIVSYKNSAVQETIDNIVKLLEATDGGNPAVLGQAVNNSVLAALMKKYTVYKELNNGKEPASIDELNLKEADLKYTDPTTGKKLDWIFFGKNSQMAIDEKTKIVVLAPKPNGENRLIGLSNGKMLLIKESQIAPFLEKLKKAEE